MPQRSLIEKEDFLIMRTYHFYQISEFSTLL